MNNWTPTDLWREAVDRLRHEIGSDNVELWLNPVEAQALDDRYIRLVVPNDFFREHIQKNYQRKLETQFRSLSGADIGIEFKIAKDIRAAAPKADPIETFSAQSEFSLSELNPRHTFANFVVGQSNRFAHATAESISKAPGTQFNPYFLYGGVGLGKTHLMHAIGNAIRKEHARARVLYTTSEQFLNEFVNSLRYEKPDSFRAKHRSLDVLLMDDIQFLTGRDRSVEEFFYTFNALFDARKQVVISSDRAPRELVAWDERMITRFSMGMVVDIKPPDLETRIAILRKKAEGEQLFVPDDVILYIATAIKTNVRELEGCLIRLSAFASLTGSHLTVDVAKDVLKDSIGPDTATPVRVDTVQKVVAQKYSLEVKTLKGKSRTNEVALPRQLSMYLCCTLTDLSTTDIGQAFGGRDHTTVIHARRKIAGMLERDPFFVELVNGLTDKIRSLEGP